MFLKIGHRGAAGHEPENTLRSFQKAIDLGMDMIELDVHVCKSREVVVIHDATINRTTNGKGTVSGKSLQELQELNAGKREKIPTLVEVLNLVQRKVKINIELKGKHTAEPVAKIINASVRQKWQYDDFLVSSFNYQELQYFHVLQPDVPIGILVKLGVSQKKEIDQALIMALKLHAYSLNLPFQYVTPRLVEQVHQLGFKVLVWTVNKTKAIEKVKNLNADGIISDYPDRL